MKYVLGFILVLTINSVIGQVNDADLAREYIQNGEYEKALLYLEKLYDENPSGGIYKWYLESLVETGDYKTAEKVVKKQVKRDERNLFLYLDWADVYLAQEKKKQAEDIYQDLLESLNNNRGQIQQLSKLFLEKQNPQMALAILEKAKELNNGGYGYEFEVAEIKGAMGKYDEMIAAYLELLHINPSYLNNVRTALLRTLNFDEDPVYARLIQDEVLKKIQQYPTVTTYNEFLIWIQLQQKDFYGAYLQSKALDLRFKEQGSRVYNIAMLAYNNEDFRIAKKIFQYLIDEPAVSSNLKIYATSYWLKLSTKDAIEKNDTIAINDIAAHYQSAIDTIGINESTVQLIDDYSRLLSGRLDENEKCEALLLKTISEGKLRDASLGRIKIALADYYVAQNNVWEASLLYIQVEKTFKEDVLGHTAKLKNAMVHYYTGSFEYAQGQLNVLKASTTKLISNDALELSLLITDNLALDTITAPLEMFARGDLMLMQQNYQDAEKTYDTILTKYAKHSLTDEILLRKYELSYQQYKFDDASNFLMQMIAVDSSDILVDKAIYLLADLYQNQLDNQELAKQYFKLIITKYPGSLYAAEARKKFRKLRGDSQTKAL
jgi:tetratricopeptide (TPR) repeat protein